MEVGGHIESYKNRHNYAACIKNAVNFFVA
jgi:hypothetical protein